jgi:hypothetical protein
MAHVQFTDVQSRPREFLDLTSRPCWTLALPDIAQFIAVCSSVKRAKEVRISCPFPTHLLTTSSVVPFSDV